jgi:hypothetical protein
MLWKKNRAEETSKEKGKTKQVTKNRAGEITPVV